MLNSYVVSGAGSGIGRAVAMRIAQTDPVSRIYLLGRNRGRLEEVRNELPRAEAHRTMTVDLRDHEELKRAIRNESLDQANLVAVVANAGVGGENEYGPDDRWDEIIATNLTGTYRLVQECLPSLRCSKKKYRSIVVVSSILARLGVPKYTAYCASKAGLLGLTRSWAAELAQDRILVNAICPGWVETSMALDGLQDMAEGSGCSLDEVRKVEMSRVPLGKMSQPDEVAALISFLLTGEQISITGQSLDINNGAIMV